MEDDLKKINEDDLKKYIFSWFLLNLGANFSWGWLSSLRFLFNILTNNNFRWGSCIPICNICTIARLVTCLHIDISGKNQNHNRVVWGGVDVRTISNFLPMAYITSMLMVASCACLWHWSGAWVWNCPWACAWQLHEHAHGWFMSMLVKLALALPQ